VQKSNSWFALACILWVGNAQAALVDFSWTGVFEDSPVAGTDFNYLLGKTVTITGTFDDSVFWNPGVAGTVSFSSGSTNTFTIAFDSYIFSNSDEVSYSLGTYPYIDINTTIDYVYLIFQSKKYGNTILSFTDSDFYFRHLLNGSEVAGIMDDTSFIMTPVTVPIPAAIWLFGSGLLGLIGISRRKKV